METYTIYVLAKDNLSNTIYCSAILICFLKYKNNEQEGKCLLLNMGSGKDTKGT